jgi:hypothetical protein
MVLELDHIFCVVDDLDHAASSAGAPGVGARRWVGASRAGHAQPARVEPSSTWSCCGSRIRPRPAPTGCGWSAAASGRRPGRVRSASACGDGYRMSCETTSGCTRSSGRGSGCTATTSESPSVRSCSSWRPPSRTSSGAGHGAQPGAGPEPARWRALREVRVRGPSRALMPPCVGPAIVVSVAPHHLELVVGEGPARPITQILTVRG